MMLLHAGGWLPRGFRRHTPERELHRFVDDELSDAERRRVLRHLEDCPRCLDRVFVLRRLKEAAREILHPGPPKELLRQILERGARGERVILPSPTAPEPTPRLVPAGVVGVIVIAGVAAAAILGVRGRVAATDSDLEISAPALPAGGAVDLEYRPATLLSGERTVRVRGEYWTSDDGPSPRERGRPIEGLLVRSGGDYEGSLRLPAGTVFAAFVVEDSSGDRIDTHGGRFWETLARDVSDRPLLQGLERRYRFHVELDPEIAGETARRMTELYPDRPEGWALLLAHQRETLDSVALAPKLREARIRLQQLVRTYAGSFGTDADLIALLRDFARRAEDTVTETWLAGELQTRFPGHPAAVRDRVSKRVASGLDSPPGGLLSYLEGEWKRYGPDQPYLALQGFETAMRTGRSSAEITWADRLQSLEPGRAERIARELAERQGTRREGIRRLRRLIEEGAEVPVLGRRLLETRTDAERDKRFHVLALRVDLGKALAAEGALDEAQQALREVTAEAWAPDALLSLADISVNRGDTTEARRLLALAAADPLVGDKAKSELQSALGLGRAEAEQVGRQAETEMARRVLAMEGPPRSLPVELQLRDLSGESCTLRDVLQGPTLLLYYRAWSRLTRDELEALSSASSLLLARGVHVLVMTSSEPAPEVRESLRKLPFPVYLDRGQDVASSLQTWEIPVYAVLDEEGFLWAVPRSLPEARRVVAALLVERATPG